MKSQAGRGPRVRKRSLPVRHEQQEVAGSSRHVPTDDEISGGQERMDVGGDMADEGNVAAAAITIEDFTANQPPLQQIQLQPQHVDLVNVDPDPSFAGPGHVLLARIQDEFMYLDMPVDGDPVWTSMSPEVLGLCIRYGALDVNQQLHGVDLYASTSSTWRA